MNRLILLRHAEAESFAAGGDAARPLTAKGRAEAGRMGRALAARGLAPELALVSTAKRARETWAEVAASMPNTRVEESDALYNAGPEGLLAAAKESGAGSVMVIAHNPGLHELAVALLVEGGGSPNLPFPPAACAAFDFTEGGPVPCAKLAPEAIPQLKVYKILAAADWEAAKAMGVFQGSADDRRDGFIHLSTHEQVAETAHRHFAGRTDLMLVAFDADSLGPALRWEPSRGGALFPHLYAPLPAAAALEAGPLPP